MKRLILVITIALTLYAAAKLLDPGMWMVAGIVALSAVAGLIDSFVNFI